LTQLAAELRLACSFTKPSILVCVSGTEISIDVSISCEHDQLARNKIVFTDRDIVCRTLARGLNLLDLTVVDCMSKPCVAVTPDMSVEECSRIMKENKIRRVPVVDADGCCAALAHWLTLPYMRGNTRGGYPSGARNLGQAR
jgi:CBS-domain-containing membrane protein